MVITMTDEECEDGQQLFTRAVKTEECWPGMVVYTYNLSYSGGEDEEEDHRPRNTWAKN
jgi:hypothetical protein